MLIGYFVKLTSVTNYLRRRCRPRSSGYRGPMRIHRVLPAAAFVLALAATACSSATSVTGGPSTGSEGPDSSSSAEPTQTSTVEPTPAPEIEDGRHFVFVKRAKDGSVTFDLAYLLTGKDAAEAAQDAGQELPVPNDYFIVNDNPKLRTVPVADGAKIMIYDWSMCCDDYTSITFDEFAGYIASPTDDFHGTLSPYWLRVQGGQIVKIEEQYLP